MIALIEGMPRAGKTYYAVSDVLKKFFVFNEETLSWQLKEDNVVVYSNVDKFVVSKNLNEAIEKAGGLGVFFTVGFQEKFTREKRHVYIIDEAQGPDFFHRKYYDQHVFKFFQYHGHFAIDIYLITQDVYSLVKEMQHLSEYHIKAVRRSYSYGKEFRYNFMVGNEIFRRRVLRKDLRVFSAYRSTVDVEGQKGSSFSHRYYIYVGMFIFVAVVGFYVMVKIRFSSPEKVETVVQSLKVLGQYKIVALYSDNALVKNLGSKKLQRVSYSAISGDLRIGAVVNVGM